MQVRVFGCQSTKLPHRLDHLKHDRLKLKLRSLNFRPNNARVESLKNVLGIISNGPIWVIPQWYSILSCFSSPLVGHFFNFGQPLSLPSSPMKSPFNLGVERNKKRFGCPTHTRVSKPEKRHQNPQWDQIIQNAEIFTNLNPRQRRQKLVAINRSMY